MAYEQIHLYKIMKVQVTVRVGGGGVQASMYSFKLAFKSTSYKENNITEMVNAINLKILCKNCTCPKQE